MNDWGIVNKDAFVTLSLIGIIDTAVRIALATFGLFYTFVIAAAAVAPPIMGRVSDMLGVDDSIRMIGWIALSNLPMAAVLSRQMVKTSSRKQAIH